MKRRKFIGVLGKLEAASVVAANVKADEKSDLIEQLEERIKNTKASQDKALSVLRMTNEERQSLHDAIYEISPADTPLMSVASKGEAHPMHKWVTDELKPL